MEDDRPTESLKTKPSSECLTPKLVVSPTMTIEKAKKLMKKTSAEHDRIFRRLAK